MNSLYFLLGISVGLVIHELGHWFAARLLGLRVAEVRFGLGPAVARWQNGDEIWLVSWGLVGGHVRLRPSTDTRRRVHVAFLFGGVLANAALAVCMIALSHQLASVSRDVDHIIGALIWSQYFLIVFNLVPLRLGGLETDGFQIAAWLFGGRKLDWETFLDSLQKQSAEYAHVGAGSLDPTDAFVEAFLRDHGQAKGGDDVLERRFDAISDAAGLLPHERAVMLDRVLTDALLALDPPREAMSRAATLLREVAKESATAKATQGSVLIRTGHPADGRSMLGSVEFDAESCLFGRFCQSLFLAFAAIELKEFDEATACILRAEKLLNDAPERPRQLLDALKNRLATEQRGATVTAREMHA